jgi:hypothetical protein
MEESLLEPRDSIFSERAEGSTRLLNVERRHPREQLVVAVALTLEWQDPHI